MKKLRIMYAVAMILFVDNVQAMGLQVDLAQPVPSSLVQWIRSKGTPILPAGKEITLGDLVGKIAYQPIFVGGELALDTEQAEQDGFSFRAANEFIPGEVVIVPSYIYSHRNGSSYQYGVIERYSKGFWQVSIGTSCWVERNFESANIGKWIMGEPPAYGMPTVMPLGAIAPVVQPIPLEPPPAYQQEPELIPGPPAEEPDDVPPAPADEPEDDLPQAPADDVIPGPPADDEDDVPPPPAPEPEDIPGPPADDEDDVPPPPADWE